METKVFYPTKVFVINLDYKQDNADGIITYSAVLGRRQ